MEPSSINKKNSLCFAVMASEPELLQGKMSFQQVCRTQISELFYVQVEIK